MCKCTASICSFRIHNTPCMPPMYVHITACHAPSSTQPPTETPKKKLKKTPLTVGSTCPVACRMHPRDLGRHWAKCTLGKAARLQPWLQAWPQARLRGKFCWVVSVVYHVVMFFFPFLNFIFESTHTDYAVIVSYLSWPRLADPWQNGMGLPTSRKIAMQLRE